MIMWLFCGEVQFSWTCLWFSVKAAVDMLFQREHILIHCLLEDHVEKNGDFVCENVQILIYKIIVIKIFEWECFGRAGEWRAGDLYPLRAHLWVTDVCSRMADTADVTKQD